MHIFLGLVLITLLVLYYTKSFEYSVDGAGKDGISTCFTLGSRACGSCSLSKLCKGGGSRLERM